MAQTQKGSAGKKKHSGNVDEMTPSALLIEDHEIVLKMFKDYEELKSNGSASEKRDLALKICAELKVHTQIEEELYYPKLREQADEASMLNEAKVEHESAQELIRQIESMSADEALYDAKVKVLGEYLKHHIKEEQNEMFPAAKKAGIETPELADEMLERKEELKRKLH